MYAMLRWAPSSIETSLLRYFNSRFLKYNKRVPQQKSHPVFVLFCAFFSALLHFSCFILSVSKIESYVPSWLIKKRSHFVRRSLYGGMRNDCKKKAATRRISQEITKLGNSCILTRCNPKLCLRISTALFTSTTIPPSVVSIKKYYINLYFQIYLELVFVNLVFPLE